MMECSDTELKNIAQLSHMQEGLSIAQWEDLLNTAVNISQRLYKPSGGDVYLCLTSNDGKGFILFLF
jgi:hypothetical protein